MTRNDAERSRVLVIAPRPKVAPVTTTAMIVTTKITSIKVNPLFFLIGARESVVT
jgi:hypothetical protein